ncbi:MAG: ImmA/IrrE family metallo-endopeptidase [Patescibacteria group bacterium]
MKKSFNYLADAEQKAQELIKKYKFNIPIELDDVEKKLNLKIEPIEFEDSISGLVKMNGKDGKPVIAVNSLHNEHRQRFTVAHELGHLFLHAVYSLHVDPENIYYRDKESSQATKIKEMQANSFAAELLMPADKIKEDIKSYLGDHKSGPEKIIKEMSKFYNVSTEAMTIRLGKYLNDFEASDL